jgi:hypothetical protein
MDIDIFIKTYKKDFKLLSYSLRSIVKNVTGYKNIVLLVPERDKQAFDTRELPANTLIHYVNDYGNGYLYQQWCKMNAYNYCNSDYILFSDCDVIFDHAINLQDFIADGKPEILFTDWDKVGNGIIWREPTERLMGEPVIAEFMRRNCLIFHKETLRKIALQYPNLEATIMNSDRFSEFNFMGAWAYKYEREKYNFINTNDWVYTPPKGIQLWSWADTGDSETHKQEYQRSIETINKVLELNLTQL